ncbi:MAG: terminase, partial [Desulfocapsa sp.]
WWRAWDLAGTEKSLNSNPDWTAGVLIGQDTDQNFYIGDVVRFRGGSAEVERTIVATAALDQRTYKNVKISIPQDPGQAGKAQKRYLAKALIGYSVRFSPETGSKFVRAEPFAAQAEAGNVFVVSGPWNEEYINELTMFPGGSFDDQIDGTSRGFNELIGRGFSYIGMRGQ